MPALLAALGSFIVASFAALFRSRIGGWVATAMVALGLAWTTNEGVIEPITQQALGALQGVHATALQWIMVMNFDKYLTIVLSAYAAGALKRAILVRRA